MTMTPDTVTIIIISTIAAIIVAAPYFNAWKISRMGKAITGGSRPVAPEPSVASWTKVRGTGMFNRNQVVCRMSLYGDRIGFHLLWGPHRFIKLADIAKAERVLSGARTTCIRLIPKDPSALERVSIQGIPEPRKFLDEISSKAGIPSVEVEEKRGLFDMWG
jgi:hypothetical protein